MSVRPTTRERSGPGERTLDLLRDGYRFAATLRARATNPDAHRAVPFRLLGGPPCWSAASRGSVSSTTPPR